ncbi:MAG: AEC family transporter [Planctomycetota bacterium]
MGGVITPLAPLIAAVALGYGLLRLGFFDDRFRRGLDKLVYWVCLPALMVDLLWAGGPDLRSAGLASVALGLGSCAVAAVAYAVGSVGRMLGPAKATLAQAAFRGNLAFVGLPVVVLASPELGGLAALAMGPLVVLYNLLAVPMLIVGGSGDRSGLLRVLMKSLTTNPLIWACAAGLAGAASGTAPPTWLGETLSLIGKPASPLALLSVGGAMAVFPLHGRLGASLLATVLKTAACPLISVAIAVALGCQGGELRVVAILASTPAAVASYVLATQLKGDHALAAGAVILSTLASVVSLAAALAWTAPG